VPSARKAQSLGAAALSNQIYACKDVSLVTADVLYFCNKRIRNVCMMMMMVVMMMVIIMMMNVV